MNSLKVATAQVKVSNSIPDNGKEIRKLIKKSHYQGAIIVHFCEVSLSGYAERQNGRLDQSKFEEIKNEISLIQKLCRQLEIWTVIGSAHKLSSENRPHNSLYIISDQGKVVNRYDKRKCSHNELKEWYTPGFESCTFEIQGVKFGCTICIEIQFPEIFSEAEVENVDCMLFSSYSKKTMFGIQAQGYAASNNFWISMAVPANYSKDQPSQFIGPNGEIVARCENEKNTIIICEIDKENDSWNLPLNLARPWRRKARIGKIYEDRKVIDKRSQLKTII